MVSTANCVCDISYLSSVIQISIISETNHVRFQKINFKVYSHYVFGFF